MNQSTATTTNKFENRYMTMLEEVKARFSGFVDSETVELIALSMLDEILAAETQKEEFTIIVDNAQMQEIAQSTIMESNSTLIAKAKALRASRKSVKALPFTSACDLARYKKLAENGHIGAHSAMIAVETRLAQ